MRRALCAALLVPVLAACAGVRPAILPAEEVPATPPAAVDARVTQGSTRFGIQLLQALRAAEGEQNRFLSPVSASLALSLVANGATGQTQSELWQALGLGGLSTAEINAANRSLQALLANPDPKVELTIANSLWYRAGRPLKQSFADLAAADYRAPAKAVPFGDPTAAAAINDWVKKETRGKIPTLLEKTEGTDWLYVVNAVYFNGKWRQPFEPSATKPAPFTRLDGSEVSVDLMHQTGRFRYLKGEGFQAAALPFGDSPLHLYLFRPDDDLTLEAFMKRLTPEAFSQWMGQFKLAKGAVALPRFKLEAQAELKPALQQMGAHLAFSDQADFGGLFASPQAGLLISSVYQKTYLSLDESGAEAAAATAVTVEATSASAEPPFNLRLDRPFFLAIRDDQSGALLFLGTVVDPR